MICGPLFNDPGTSRGWREDDDPAQSPSEFPGAQVAYLLPSSTIRNSVKKFALFQDLMWLDSLCIQSLFPLSSDTQLFSHLYSSKGGSSVRATAWIPHEGWLFEKALRTLLLSYIYIHTIYTIYTIYTHDNMLNILYQIILWFRLSQETSEFMLPCRTSMSAALEMRTCLVSSHTGSCGVRFGETNSGDTIGISWG